MSRAKHLPRLAPSSLEKRRVRTAKVTSIVVLLLLLALAFSRVISDWLTTIHPAQYLFDSTFGASSENITGSLDPLNLASEELLFEGSQNNDTVFWYSTLGAKGYSLALVDKALKEQGWADCSSVESQSGGYLRYAEDKSTFEYAMVICYEHNEGSSIIIELVS